MIFRTGDILLWNSTVFYDLLGDYTLGLGGYHSSIILKGKSFEQFSECGSSPTDTYVTFRLIKLFPIEEVVATLWTKPNGSSLYILKRSSKFSDISEELALTVYQEYSKFYKVDNYRTTKLAILAYLGLGYYEDDPIETKTNFNLCPWLVAYFLVRFGLIKEKADINSLLPYNYFNLDFYQKQKYKKIEIFNKGTMSSSWLLASPLIVWGLVDVKEQRNSRLERIIGDYPYPKYSGELR